MALTRLCLDTSAYSQFMRGDPAAVAAIDRASWVGIPTIVLGELHSGFRAGRQAERNEQELDRFLGFAVVETLPVDHEVARVYADIVVALRRNGTPLPTNDVWIAATAASSASTLLAYDSHFQAVDRISLRLLEPAPPQ